MQGTLHQISPAEYIRVGTVVLQVVATFSLIWAAAVGYLFKEIRNLRASKIRELRGETESGTYPISDEMLFYTSFGVWTGGIGLSLTIYTTVLFLHRHLSGIISLILSLLAIVAIFGASFVISATRLVLENLKRDDLLENDYMRYLDIATAIIVFLGTVIAMVIYIFTV